MRLTVCVPVLAIVEVRSPGAPSSMSRRPKASVAGVRESSVWVPSPVSATVIAGAFEVTVSVATLPPTVVGSKRSRSAQVSPGSSTVVGAQSPVTPVSRAKWPASPVSARPVKVTVSVPEFVTVEVWEAVAPSSMSRPPKAMATGSRDSSVRGTRKTLTRWFRRSAT